MPQWPKARRAPPTMRWTARGMAPSECATLRRRRQVRHPRARRARRSRCRAKAAAPASMRPMQPKVGTVSSGSGPRCALALPDRAPTSLLRASPAPMAEALSTRSERARAPQLSLSAVFASPHNLTGLATSPPSPSRATSASESARRDAAIGGDAGPPERGRDDLRDDAHRAAAPPEGSDWGNNKFSISFSRHQDCIAPWPCSLATPLVARRGDPTPT